MVAEAFLGGVVHPEAFALTVVIDQHRTAFPTVVALDTEVIVPLRCEGGLTGPRLDNALRQGDAGGDAGTVHLIDGNGGVAGDIAFLRRTGLPLCGDGESQDQGDGSKELLHTFEIELISKIRKKIRFRTRRRRPRRKIRGRLPGTPPRTGAGPCSGRNNGR